MESKEPNSVPTETGSVQGAQSGASRAPNIAGGATPPRGNTLSLAWQLSRIAFFIACAFGIAVIVGVVATGLKGTPQLGSTPSVGAADFDFAGGSAEVIQEWKTARAYHEVIALAIVHCLNLGDLYSQPGFIKLLLGVGPSGELDRYVNATISSNKQPLKLTKFQRAVIYLSNAIARAKIQTAIEADDNYTRMKHFHWAVAIIGAITTILISIKSMSNQNTPLYFIIGISAIVCSSIGTAASALNSFHNPREAYMRNQRALSLLKQLHVEVAAEVTSETDADKCPGMENDNGRKVKDWSQRLAGILNAPETAHWNGRGQGDGGVTPKTEPGNGNETTPEPTQAGLEEPSIR